MYRFLAIDESRLRLHLYLHQHLDLDSANQFWNELTGIRLSQFRAPYRAVADPPIRKSKHLMGCPAVVYSSATALRRVMGMIEAVVSPVAFPG
jgi:hypothetical protein